MFFESTLIVMLGVWRGGLFEVFLWAGFFGMGGKSWVEKTASCSLVFKELRLGAGGGEGVEEVLFGRLFLRICFLMGHFN